VSDASSPYMATMLKVLLGVPEPLKIYHLIPIGYPAGPVAPRPRRELDEIVHHERYDRKKFRSDQEMHKFIVTLTRRGAYGKQRWVEDDAQS
ncbi:MAG: hypothetical protein ACE5JO_07290, partial [Candidatus Binatia bacterium]